MWPFGLACWLWGTIYIDRLNGDQAKTTINKTATIIREKKVGIMERNNFILSQFYYK